jgi:hypothetical protein
MMHKIICLLIMSFIIPTLLIAQGTAGTNSGSILTYYPDAAVQATGNAGIASLRPNWQLVQLNPAFVSLLRYKSFGFTHSNMYADMKLTNFNFVNQYDDMSYYTGLKYFDYGNFTRTTYDDDNLGGFSAKSFVLSGYIATPPIHNIYTGIGMKYFYEKLDRHNGQALAIDLGGLYVFENYPVAIGLSIQNIGTQIKYSTRSEDLPLLIRLGGSYYVLDNRLAIFVDLEKVRSQDSNMYFGAEFQISEHFTVRGGINSANEIGKGLALGFDVEILLGLSLNYAYIDNNHFEGTHKITISYLFERLDVKEPLQKTAKKMGEAYDYVIEKYNEYKVKYEAAKRDERMPKEASIDTQRKHLMKYNLEQQEDVMNYDSVFYNLAIINYQRGNYSNALENVNKISTFDSDALRLKQMIEEKLKK